MKHGLLHRMMRPLPIVIATMIAIGSSCPHQAFAKTFTFIFPIVKSVSVTPAGPIIAGKPVTILCVRGGWKKETLDTGNFLGDFIANKLSPPYRIPVTVSVGSNPHYYKELQTFYDPSYPSLTSTRTDPVTWTPPQDLVAKTVMISCTSGTATNMLDSYMTYKSINVPFISKGRRHQPLPKFKSSPPPMRLIPRRSGTSTSTGGNVPPSPCAPPNPCR